MQKTILDINDNTEEQLSINLLVTKDMYPMPESAVIDKNIGEENILLTNKNGEVIKVVNGIHMILEMNTSSLFDWLGNKEFWMFDAEKNIFKLMLIEM